MEQLIHWKHSWKFSLNSFGEHFDGSWKCECGEEYREKPIDFNLGILVYSIMWSLVLLEVLILVN